MKWHFAQNFIPPVAQLKITHCMKIKPLRQIIIWSGSPDPLPTWPLLLKIKKRGDEIKKISISETTGPIGTKPCLDSPRMIPFQNCVRQSRSLTNMAT
jgi:hypothetical protein